MFYWLDDLDWDLGSPFDFNGLDAKVPLGFAFPFVDRLILFLQGAIEDLCVVYVEFRFTFRYRTMLIDTRSIC